MILDINKIPLIPGKLYEVNPVLIGVGFPEFDNNIDTYPAILMLVNTYCFMNYVHHQFLYKNKTFVFKHIDHNSYSDVSNHISKIYSFVLKS